LLCLLLQQSLVLLHLHHLLKVVIVLVFVKGEFDSTFNTGVVGSVRGGVVGLLWWCLFLVLLGLLVVSSPRIEILNLAATHDMLFHVVSNLARVDIVRLSDWSLLSCVPGVWMQILLEIVTIELAQTLVEEHVSNRLAF